MINRYQEKLDQISKKYLTDFSRILKNICWKYPNISQISVNSGQRVKNLKIAENSCGLTESNSRISRISTGYKSLLYNGYGELPPLGTTSSTPQDDCN